MTSPNPICTPKMSYASKPNSAIENITFFNKKCRLVGVRAQYNGVPYYDFMDQSAFFQDLEV